jgi:transcriptional regulator with XRE-family HTH domain
MIMEISDKNPTFGSRLREKRLAKGWSQYYLAERAGCTNSNISYLENHPHQRPKIETVEALAGALDWPINEARHLAGYPECDLNISRIDVEDEFRYALYGYKRLSARGKELVRRQIGMLIDLVFEFEQGTGEPDHIIPEMTLDELDQRIADRKKGEGGNER